LKELKRLEEDAAEKKADFDEMMGKGDKKEEKKEEKKEASLISIYGMETKTNKGIPSMSQARSDPICSSSGWCGPGHVPHDVPHEVDYGHDAPLDSDIINTHTNLKNTEKTLGHTWKLPKSAGLAALGSDMRSDPPWNSHDGYETRDH